MLAHTYVIPVLERLRQEDCAQVQSHPQQLSEALSNLVRPCFQIKYKIDLGA